MELYKTLHEMLKGDDAYVSPKRGDVERIAKDVKRQLEKVLGREDTRRLGEFLDTHRKDEDFGQVVGQVYFAANAMQAMYPSRRTAQEHARDASAAAVQLHRIVKTCRFKVDEVLRKYFTHQV